MNDVLSPETLWIRLIVVAIKNFHSAILFTILFEAYARRGQKVLLHLFRRVAQCE